MPYLKTRMQNEKCKSFSQARRKLENNTNVLPHQLERKIWKFNELFTKIFTKNTLQFMNIQMKFFVSIYFFRTICFIFIHFCLPYDLYEVMYVQRKSKSSKFFKIFFYYSQFFTIFYTIRNCMKLFIRLIHKKFRDFFSFSFYQPFHYE